VLRLEAKRATKYISEKEVVSVQRKSYKGKIDKSATSIDLIVKIGKPNYEERLFIKKLKKAGEPFPVKIIQLKFFK
jgi:hypothetical protein